MRSIVSMLAGALVLIGLMFNSVAVAGDSRWHLDFGGVFVLKNAKGEVITNENLIGKTTLVYFGYTSCLMQCPPTWITLDAVMRNLGDNANKVQIFFVSIDPDRDTVEQISEWQKDWPLITALTETRAEVEAVAEAFHVFFARKPKHAMPFAMRYSAA